MKSGSSITLSKSWWKKESPDGLKKSGAVFEKALGEYEKAEGGLNGGGAKAEPAAKAMEKALDALAGAGKQVASEAKDLAKKEKDKKKKVDLSNTEAVMGKPLSKEIAGTRARIKEMLEAAAEQAAEEAKADEDDEDAGAFASVEAHAAYLKKWAPKIKRKVVNFAVGLPSNKPEEMRFNFHPKKAGRGLANTLKKEAGAKKFTFGQAGTDALTEELGEEGAGGRTLILTLEGKHIPGLAKRVKLMLKALGVSQFGKVQILAGGEEVDGADEADPDSELDALDLDAAEAEDGEFADDDPDARSTTADTPDLAGAGSTTASPQATGSDMAGSGSATATPVDAGQSAGQEDGSSTKLTVEERKAALKATLEQVSMPADTPDEVWTMLDRYRQNLEAALAAADGPVAVQVIEERTHTFTMAVAKLYNPEYAPAPHVTMGDRMQLSIDEEVRLRNWVAENAMAEEGGGAGEVGGDRLTEALKGKSSLGELSHAEKRTLAHLTAINWIESPTRKEDGAYENIRELTAHAQDDPDLQAYVVDAFMNNEWQVIGEMPGVQTRDIADEMARSTLDIDPKVMMGMVHDAQSAAKLAHIMSGEQVREIPGVDDRDRFAFIDRMHHPDGTALIPEFTRARQNAALNAVGDGAMNAAAADGFTSYMFADASADDMKDPETRKAMANALGTVIADSHCLVRDSDEAKQYDKYLEDAFATEGGRQLLFNGGVPAPLRNWALNKLVPASPGELPEWSASDLAGGWESKKVGETFLSEQIAQLSTRGKEPRAYEKGPALTTTIGQAFQLPTHKMPKKGEIPGEDFAYYDESKSPIREIMLNINDNAKEHGKANITVIPITVASNEWGTANFNLIRIDDPDGSVEFIDGNGREYDSVSEWKDKEELPPGRMTFPKDLSLESGQTDTKMSNKDHWTERALAILDTAVIIVGTLAGIMAVVATGGAAAPAVAAAAAAYGAARTGADLYEDSTVGVDVWDMKNPQNRGKWFDLGTSVLSVGAIGGGIRAASLASRGAKMSRTGANVAAALQISAGAADGAAMVNTIVTLEAQWDQLNDEQKAMAMLQLGFQFGMGGASMKAGGGRLGDGFNPKRVRNQLEHGSPYDLKPLKDDPRAADYKDLKPGQTAVIYDTDKKGRPKNYRIVYGGDQKPDRDMIRLHTQAAAGMEASHGLKARLIEFLGGDTGTPPPGTRAWEAHFEIDKIGAESKLIMDRMNAGEVTPEQVPDLRNRLDELTDAMALERKKLDDLMAAGRGYVAAPSKGSEDAAALKWPTEAAPSNLSSYDPARHVPPGHHWKTKGPGQEPELIQHDSSRPSYKFDKSTKTFILQSPVDPPLQVLGSANRGGEVTVDGSTKTLTIGADPVVQSTGEKKTFETEAGKVDIDKKQAQTFGGGTVDLISPATRIKEVVQNPDGTYTIKRWETEAKKNLIEVTYTADGFPIMPSKVDVYIPAEAAASKRDYAHFKAANEALIEAIQRDASLGQSLGITVSDIRANMNGPPDGYTWHHHQNVGLMQLVPFKTHDKMGHTGGMKIWGAKT